VRWYYGLQLMATGRIRLDLQVSNWDERIALVPPTLLFLSVNVRKSETLTSTPYTLHDALYTLNHRVWYVIGPTAEVH
jgi:hypothetical protein